MLVVHIGLGKTATTTLQRHVFTRLHQLRPDISSYNVSLRRLCRKHHLFGLSGNEIAEARRMLDGGITRLVSDESLVNWNPRQWELASQRNLDLFGEDAVIVITVREPLSYLTSVYQQKIHEGNVKPPSDFFVSSEIYDALAQQLPSWKLEYFDIDSFCLGRLYNLYTARFKTVYMVPLEAVSNFAFLEKPFSLSEDEVAELRQAFNQAAIANRAYSDLAMRLTFVRESVLRKFGSKSIGSHDRSLLAILNELNGVLAEKPTGTLFRDLRLVEKIRQFPLRTIRRLMRLPSWRSLMQTSVNCRLPYKKYRLPDTIGLNKRMVQKNREFLRSL